MKKSTFDQRQDEYFRPRSTGAPNEPLRLRMMKTAPLRENNKHAVAAAAAAFPQSSENIDFDKQFGKESMWLSSDSSSPSSSPSAFFRDYGWCDSFHPSVENFLPSWLSLLAITNRMEEAYNLPIQKTSPVEDKNLPEDDVVARDSSVTYESVESISGKSYEDSPSCTGNSSSTPLSTKSNSCQSLDSERLGCRVSLLNLDGDDCELVPGTDPTLDCYLSEFPSPSYKSSWSSPEFESYNSSVSTPSTEAQTKLSRYELSLQHASEAADLEDLNTDEPLFWPYERKIDWNSEATWTYFSMSPRKGITSVGTPPDSVPLRRHDRNMDPTEGRRRRLVFSSGSTASKIMELKQRYSKGVRRTNTSPSRLSRATKSSEKIVHSDGAVKPKNRNIAVKSPVGMVKDPIEVDFASNELPIETFLGFGEFDGREGLDSDFNKDDFSLQVSLC